MNKNHLIISSAMGALGVILGAFGAHSFKSILSPEMLETYKTGILYHLIHSVVLLAISLNQKFNLKVPFYFILTGIILFSFSIYIYCLTGTKTVVMITPVGGMSLIIGWISIIYYASKK